MKLEKKFFNSFFYTFLIGILLDMIIDTILIYKFTNNYYDKRTAQKIIDLEKKYAKININSVNTLLTTTLLKVQASLNELVLFYQKLANKTNEITNHTISEFLLNPLEVDEDYLKNNSENLKYKAFWFIDGNTMPNNISNYVKSQLIVFSNIIQNVYATIESAKPSVMYQYFFFEKTDLFIAFPLSYYYLNNYLIIYKEFKNPQWCRDSNGKSISVYFIKCRDFFVNIKKAQAGLFDNNKSNYKDRTIYITNSYKQFGIEENYTTIFTVCIQFNDPISGGLGYFIVDIGIDNLIYTFDYFNDKLSGYYLITSVGFNNVFYFPQMHPTIATPTENIFGWNRTFYLDEKTYFMNNIQKIMTSSYNHFINKNSFFDEIKVNGVNEQSFYFNGEKYIYSIYPVFLENLRGEKEHILSIVYIYNNQLYYSNFESYQSNAFLKILLEIIIYVIFGSGLLYLVVLSFNSLAKYIVIPIKNVNYMLKGIHIGGENRLEYLDFLKKRQNDNLEKLEKLYHKDNEKKNRNENNDNNDNGDNNI